MRSRWFLVTIVLGCLLVAVGCGSDDGNDPGPQSDPETTPTPESTAVPFEMDDVVWTTDVDDETGEPMDEVESYTTVSPAVIAVVPLTNVPAGTELTATWTIDGLDVPEATMSVTVDQDMSTAWLSFEFLRDEGRYFPLGKLEVTVTASNGESVQGSVEIELP